MSAFEDMERYDRHAAAQREALDSVRVDGAKLRALRDAVAAWEACEVPDELSMAVAVANVLTAARGLVR